MLQKTIKNIVIACLFTVLFFSQTNISAAEHQGPKYVFFFIGDGMASQQLYATEMFAKEKRTSQGIEIDHLAMSSLPVNGTHRNYATNRIITDSAAAATAMASGKKTSISTVGMDSERKKSLPTIAEVLKERYGMKVGIISSVSLDHATPACFYAHRPSRNNYWEISMQLANSGFEYFAGGGLKGQAVKDGKRQYMPGKDNVATKENDPIEVAKENGYKIITSKQDLFNANPSEKVYAYSKDYLASGEAMPYEIDRGQNDCSLADYTREGIRLLDNPQGFFMMVEGGKIDWACHANDAVAAIHDVLALDDAIKEAITFMEKHPTETLIIVSGDHETGGMTLGWAGTGYDTTFKMLSEQKMTCESFVNNILNPYTDKKKAQNPQWNNTIDMDDEIKSIIEDCFGLKYSKLSSDEQNLLEDAYDATMNDKPQKPDLGYRLTYAGYNPLGVSLTHLLNRKAGLCWGTYSHTAAPVPVYAGGKGAELFGGFIENSDFPRLIGESMGFSFDEAASAINTKIASNPIFKDKFTADPSAHVFKDGRLYVYMTSDEGTPPPSAPWRNYSKMARWYVSSTADMVNWTEPKEILSVNTIPWASSRAWAASAAYDKNTDKYLFYYRVRQMDDKWVVGIAESDTLTGPFTNPQLLVTSTVEENWNIDPCVLVDHDGRGYIYCSGLIAELTEDLRGIKRDTIKKLRTDEVLVNFKENNRGSFTLEGPFVFKKDGKYILLVAAWGYQKIMALSSDNPLGPFTYDNVVMEQDKGMEGNNHVAMVEFQNQWYMFYHRHLGGRAKRQVCIEKAQFVDGLIKPIVRSDAPKFDYVKYPQPKDAE